MSDPSSHRAPCRLPISALLFCPLLAACLLLSACLESGLPDGAVAEVNGQTISLRLVQALMDSRSVDMGAPDVPMPEEMKRRYGEALATLIIARLAEEDLAERDQALSEEAVSHEEQLIRDDYGSEDVTVFLEREGLDYADWRQLLRLHLTLRALERQVLLPGIRISVEEVRAYHAAHADRFTLPDHLRLCFLSSDDRRQLEAYCRHFPDGRDDTPDGLFAQCLDMREAELPPAERKEVAALSEGACGKIREAGGRFQAFGLVARHKGGAQPASMVYPLIEASLREQKLREALAGWLAQRLPQARIRVVPAMRSVLEDMARRSEAREQERKTAAAAAPAESGQPPETASDSPQGVPPESVGAASPSSPTGPDSRATPSQGEAAAADVRP